MQNEEDQNMDLYIPRNCSETNRLITSKDHASVQINILDTLMRLVDAQSNFPSLLYVASFVHRYHATFDTIRIEHNLIFMFDYNAGFLESLWRDIDMNRLHPGPLEDINLIIISHGLAIRVFMMKWFKWTVEQFEVLNNVGNCEFRVMELGSGGDYSLAIHHSNQEMEEWGLTPDMISDQHARAQATRDVDWSERSLGTYVNQFTNFSEDGDASPPLSDLQ